MSKISNSQLFAMLLSVRAFGIICAQASADASHMAGAALSIAAQFILAVPMLLLYRQSGFSLQKEMLFGKFGKLLYAVFFIIWGALSFNRLWAVSTSVYFPVESSLACAIILAAVCLYCSSLKLKALSRSSLIVAGIFIFSVAVMIFGAYSKADPANYIPDSNFKNAAMNAVQSFCSSGEPVMLFILLEFTGSDRKKGTAAFFTGSFILTELIYIIKITVLGRIITLTDFPFFTAGAFSQPLSIQRSDSLYMITFTLLCVLTVTLQLLLTSMLLEEIIPDLKYNKLLSVILMLGLSALLNYTNADISPLTGILAVILSVVIPVIMLIRRICNDKKNSGGVSGNDNALRVQS